MKLLTYNFLTSKCIRGVKVGYPLKLKVSPQSCANRFSSTNIITKYSNLCDIITIHISQQIEKREDSTSEFNPEFITRLIPKLDWPTVRSSAELVITRPGNQYLILYLNYCIFFTYSCNLDRSD